MNVMRIVICDTNPAELEWYAAHCRSICERKRIPAVFSTFTSSDALLFEMMDPAFSTGVSILMLEPFNGCEKVAEQVRGMGYDGVILYHSRTAEEKYFLQAFDARAFNFAKKGVQDRFETVFEGTLQAAADLERQYIVLRFASEYRQIELRDIYYFEGSKNHLVCVWYKDGNFLFRSNLSELEKRLAPHAFIRVHRSYLVAIDTICRVSYEQITLITGTTIPVGRGGYYAAVKEAVEKRSLI